MVAGASPAVWHEAIYLHHQVSPLLFLTLASKLGLRKKGQGACLMPLLRVVIVSYGLMTALP